MRFAFLTAILFAGYFFFFGIFPIAPIVAFQEVSTPIDPVSEAPAAPMINKATKGGKLFLENCARCHSAKLTKDLTGPALWGIGDRVPDRELLAAWIRNSSKVLETGDPYFNDLYEEWNKAAMDPMIHLKPDEIEAIIDELTNPS